MMFGKKYLFVLALLVTTISYAESFNISQETKKETKEILKHTKDDSSKLGSFAVSGNAIIFQRNGSLVNNGFLKGSINATGEEAKGKSKKGEITVEGQGNGISSVGYSPFSNKNDVNKSIEKVENKGFIAGEASLKGGNAEIYGEVSSISTGNGILAYALADYGEIIGSDGKDSGIVDGIGGASKSASAMSLKNTFTVGNNVVKKNDSIIKTPHERDFNGKNNQIYLKKVENYGTISGNIKIKTEAGYPRETTTILGEEGIIQPQWRSISTTASGNGISGFSYITTPVKQTYAENKINKIVISSIDNKSLIEGNAVLEAGSKGTLTYTHSYGSGNGISAISYTNNNAKQETIASIEEIKNEGFIKGYLKEIAGENTSRGWHEYSNAKATASGNGVSVYSRSSNYQVKNNEASLKKVENKGFISGKIFAKAGAGYGENMAQIESSGNGLAVFSRGKQKKVVIEDVKNDGIINGKAIVYGGKDKKALDAQIADRRFYVPINEKSLPAGESDNLKEDNSGYLVPPKTQEEKERRERNEKILALQKELKEKLNLNQKDIYEIEKGVKDSDRKILEEGKRIYLEGIQPEIKKLNEKILKLEDNAKWNPNYDRTELNELKAKVKDLEEREKKYSNLAPESMIIESLEAYNNKVNLLEDELKKVEKELAEKKENLKFHKEGTYGYIQTQKEINNLKVKLENEKKELAKKLKEKENLSEGTKKLFALKTEIQKIEKEILALSEKKEGAPTINHKENVIQTTSDVYASGNGISVQQEGTGGSEFGGLTNKGVVSGYAEVYHGHSQGNYTRIAYQGSGAGLAVRGEVQKKVINIGIISGSDFALLSAGKKEDTYNVNDPNFLSGFKDGVDNYGILAGRVIIGGYKSSASANEGYEYFETIYKDKNHYNNLGLFLVLDKQGEVKKIIKGNNSGKYEGKDIVNIDGLDESYQNENNLIENKIINGVGKDGLIITKESQNKNIDNSIVNGFKTAVKIRNNGLTKISNSTINANGFGKSYAILGDEGANKVEITNKSIINGKIDLGAGDDVLIVGGDSKLNREVNLGTGNNTLSFGKRENETRALSHSVFGTSLTTSPIFIGVVENANNVEVNENIALSSSSRISGVKELNVTNGKTLDYYFAGKENQAFADLAGSNRVLKVNGNGRVNLVPVGDKIQIGYEKDLLGFTFATNNGNNSSNSNNNSGNNNNNSKNIPNIPNGNFFIDPRLTPFEKYSKGAFDAYIIDYKKTGIDFLKDYKSSQEVFKNYLYNLTNNNPVGYLKDSAIDTVLAYYKASTDSNFAKKGQITVSGETFNIRNKYYENNKVVSNGALAEINYGTSDDTNIGLNIGGGKSKVKSTNEDLKSEVLVLGVNAEYRVKNFSWKNEISYGRIKPKKYSALDMYSLYSQLGYNIPLSETWSLTPKVSVFLSKVKQKEMTVNNIKVAKDDDTFVETTVGTELNKKFVFGSSGINFGLGVDYSLVKDLDNSKAHFIGGSTEFDLRNYDRKNRTTAEIKVGYEHISGVTATFRFRKNKDITSSSFGIGYKF